MRAAAAPTARSTCSTGNSSSRATPTAMNFAADRRVARLAAAGRIQPALIVAIDNLEDDRFRQYMPQTIYDQAEGGLRAAIDRELARLAGRPLVSAQFIRFLTTRLKPYVDAHYRTLAGPPRHRHLRRQHGRRDGRRHLRRGAAGIRPRRLHLAEMADLRRTLHRASAAAFDLARLFRAARRPGRAAAMAGPRHADDGRGHGAASDRDRAAAGGAGMAPRPQPGDARLPGRRPRLSPRRPCRWTSCSPGCSPERRRRFRRRDMRFTVFRDTGWPQGRAHRSLPVQAGACLSQDAMFSANDAGDSPRPVAAGDGECLIAPAALAQDRCAPAAGRDRAAARRRRAAPSCAATSPRSPTIRAASAR